MKNMKKYGDKMITVEAWNKLRREALAVAKHDGVDFEVMKALNPIKYGHAFWADDDGNEAPE